MKRDVDTCVWCDEPILPGEPRAPFGTMHDECGLRSVLGSVGHQRGLCFCYGGTEEDPDWMTVRQAAIAAAEYHYLGKVPSPPPSTDEEK